jgi:polyferredoxin
MLVYPFLGRIWCSICPFMAVGNLAQETVTRFGVELKKWPKWASSIGAAFAFSLFFAILMWEELWNLPQNGALSAWLLLLITSGAVFNSVQFENRMWCRYLCPIGAMCRTFGTISMVEVRSWKANCEGCADPVCVKGKSPTLDPADTFAIKGCTMQVRVLRRQNVFTLFILIFFFPGCYSSRTTSYVTWETAPCACHA